MVVIIVMCHFYQLTSPLTDTSSSRNWKSFVEAHPGRVSDGTGNGQKGK